MARKEKAKAEQNTPKPASSCKDGSKDKKGQKTQPTSTAAGEGAAAAAPPPKPTVKQIIGGSSWTGKLPVNLLSEYCQKQRWEKPEYDTRKTPEGFSVWVTLSAKDGKTQQLMRLEPFKIAQSHKHLLQRETALEARHAAATYALFRVCSMQNKHTVLPPDHKALWKEFAALKTQDVKDGKGWMYEADPFKTLMERQEAKAAAEKKKREAEAAKEKAKEMPGASGLALLNGGSGNMMKGWTRAPKVEMGRQTRTQLEALLRQGITWNPHGIRMSQQQKKNVIAQVSKIGFRRSHVAEAVEYCKDQEETLEWLLIHVPEDDLPPWALPESYSAGISVGATNLKREGIIKSLSETGYSLELCARVLDGSGGDEAKAAETLQHLLLSTSDEQDEADDSPSFLDMGSPEEQWEEEVASLEAIYGDGFGRVSSDVIQLRLESVKNAQNPKDGNVETFVQIRRPSSYPRKLLVAIIAKLPSYIKLSIIKKALVYMQESLQEEPTKMYLVIDWIQQHINDIIDNPGRLVDISAVSSTAAETAPAKAVEAPKPRQVGVQSIKWQRDEANKAEWLRRQESRSLREMVGKRQKLPAWEMRHEIVETVRSKDVTIISGETGSGKSTQSVQFILDDLYSRGLGGCANIIVTQPRRISALGLADRVAEERCSRVGHEVGYSIRGESKRSKETRLSFVTTGVLLRRLQTSGGRMEDVVASLANVSHVVIDEVHERSLDGDFLLNLIREVMRINRGMLKLVLMSATLDVASFSAYFGSEGLSVGSVEIEGRTFPVEEFHLEDVIRMTGFGAEAGDKGFTSDEAMSKTIQGLGSRINYKLLKETVKAIDFELSYEKSRGGILVFLPGVGEINRACGDLRECAGLHVLPLHASLETLEQKRVFGQAPAGKRKVVVATNVAETSITIEDIVAVVDSGKVKETSFDAQSKMSRLEERWASRAACKQRRGRAGRVQAGQCYKLYTAKLEQQHMAERPEPEMRRVALEQLCLSVRAMGVRDVGRFLERCPTAPDGLAVEGAMKLLGRMGALEGEELTALGQQLAMLPTDLRCGKLMVLGGLFGCLDDCVSMAAILSTKSPFFAPPDRRDEAREARQRFSSRDGDVVTDLEAFDQWRSAMEAGEAQRQVRSFCHDSFLHYNSLLDIASTREHYYEALRELRLASSAKTRREAGRGRDRPLLRALLAAAFTPQMARIQYPDPKYASSMSGAVELDPEAKAIKFFSEDSGRVFAHPGSTLFGSQGFVGGAGWMSYFGLMATSKVFMRDLTPFNTYTLLLFCGSIELDTLGRGLVVDGWIRLRGWARIGVLVARLRGMVDALIARKVENPGLDVGGEAVIKMVAKLVELNGLDA
ncbi:hypothetical protein CDD81_5821 [Ophiocordyceps australis]|uniref:Uncharacterized protein n=1 Tax=Ophiocordyceps australis TaxID=1399860 RepID=A0A2C5Y858_9HYPO|nr:hypothetical protein CDD81_5821 [Ophiocordyceps australis]